MTLVRHEKALDTTIAMLVRGARSMLGWSQAELAERAGVTSRTLADLETGRRLPREETRLKIVAALAEAGIELIEGNGRVGLMFDPTAKSSRNAGPAISAVRRPETFST